MLTYLFNLHNVDITSIVYLLINLSVIILSGTGHLKLYPTSNYS